MSICPLPCLSSSNGYCFMGAGAAMTNLWGIYLLSNSTRYISQSFPNKAISFVPAIISNNSDNQKPKEVGYLIARSPIELIKALALDLQSFSLNRTDSLNKL